jgi:hypothetical protein
MRCISILYLTEKVHYMNRFDDSETREEININLTGRPVPIIRRLVYPLASAARSELRRSTVGERSSI